MQDGIEAVKFKKTGGRILGKRKKLSKSGDRMQDGMKLKKARG